MDRLRIKGVECKCKELERRLKAQLINIFNDQTTTTEMIR